MPTFPAWPAPPALPAAPSNGTSAAPADRPCRTGRYPPSAHHPASSQTEPCGPGRTQLRHPCHMRYVEASYRPDRGWLGRSRGPMRRGLARPRRGRPAAGVLQPVPVGRTREFYEEKIAAGNGHNSTLPEPSPCSAAANFRWPRRPAASNIRDIPRAAALPGADRGQFDPVRVVSEASGQHRPGEQPGHSQLWSAVSDHRDARHVVPSGLICALPRGSPAPLTSHWRACEEEVRRTARGRSSSIRTGGIHVELSPGRAGLDYAAGPFGSVGRCRTSGVAEGGQVLRRPGTSFV